MIILHKILSHCFSMDGVVVDSSNAFILIDHEPFEPPREEVLEDPNDEIANDEIGINQAGNNEVDNDEIGINEGGNDEIGNNEVGNGGNHNHNGLINGIRNGLSNGLSNGYDHGMSNGH